MFKSEFKILPVLIYSTTLLLVFAIAILFKIIIWDKELLGKEYIQEEPFVCGVTEDDYPYIPSETVNLKGLKLNQTGETLFKNNCTACHAFQEVVVGPELKNVTERRSKEWLQKFILNSGKLISSGDPGAVKLFEEYDHQQMPSFAFSLSEVDSILNYIEVYSGAISDIPYPIE